MQNLTLAIAVLGAVLGVINTCHSLWKDRVRLKVSARRWVNGAGESGVCVETLNLSAFHITVAEIHVPISRKEKYVCIELLRNLPKRLEPRAIHTFHFRSSAFEHPKCPERGKLMVITACDVRRLTNHVRLK